MPDELAIDLSTALSASIARIVKLEAILARVDLYGADQWSNGFAWGNNDFEAAKLLESFEEWIESQTDCAHEEEYDA